MFFEEALVNEVLCFRTSPQGKYIPYSLELLQDRYLSLKEKLRVSELALDEAQRLLNNPSPLKE